jgi:hypothetical protein
MTTPSTAQAAQGAADPQLRAALATIITDLSIGLYFPDEFTSPAAASTNAIKTSIATSTSSWSYSGAALNGSVGTGALAPARPITASSSSSTGAYTLTAMTVVGTDLHGNALTDTMTPTQVNGSETISTTKAFASVTSISGSAMSNTAGAWVFGFGAGLGLRRLPKLRAGMVAVVAEIANAARVTTGTFTAPTSAGPNGTYLPAAAPDGTKSYCVFYELP